MRRRLQALSVALAVARVRARYPYGTWDNAYGNETLSCNSSIASANASGIFTFAVDYPLPLNYTAGQTIQNLPDPSWALTIDEAHGTTQRTIWYDTAGQKYSNDLALTYDVCAFVVDGLPKNTIELGQNDPGDCSSMISSPCRDAILTRLEDSAQQWTSYWSPPPYSNLSAGVLPTLCSYILADLGDDGKQFPKQCAQEFGFTYNTKNIQAYNRDVSTSDMPLTGFNQSILNETACTLNGNGKTFQPLSPEFSTQADAYDTYTRDVMPVMTVTFAVANYERTSSSNSVNSTMRCLRVKEFSNGSRVSPTLPSGTPYSYAKGLSGGAIAGIVVGVVVFVAVVGGLAFWFWRRRKAKSTARRDLAETKGNDLDELRSNQLHELKSVDRKIETDSNPVVEKDGSSPVAELGAGYDAAELPEKSKPAELSA